MYRKILRTLSTKSTVEPSSLTMMKRKLAAEPTQAPAKRLKVHASGYTFEFINDVQINEGEIFMPIPEWYIEKNNTYVSNQGTGKKLSWCHLKTQSKERWV